MIGTVLAWHRAKIEEAGDVIRVSLVRPCAPGAVAALREAGFRGPVEAMECRLTPRAIFDAQAILTTHYGPQIARRSSAG